MADNKLTKAAGSGRDAADEAARTARTVADEAARVGEQTARAGADMARRGAETARDDVQTGLNTATQTFQRIDRSVHAGVWASTARRPRSWPAARPRTSRPSRRPARF